MQLKKIVFSAIMIGLSFGSSAYAIFGVGVHYDIDVSVGMEDQKNETLVFDQLNLNTVTTNNIGFTGLNGTQLPESWASEVISPKNIPIYFDRENFSRTPFALGAKVYVDILPFIDCIEIGGDIATWQYDGRIRYPSKIEVPDNTGDLLSMIENNSVNVQYDTMDLSLEGNGLKFPGIKGTPFVKLNLNATIRKYISIMLIDRFIKPYVGVGFDIHYATPVPSADLVNDVVGGALKGNMSLYQISEVLSDPDNQKDVVKEIINRMITPHFGIDIVAGTIVKPPVIPLGIYIDGKLMIPFESFDENVDITGLGFKINAGVVLHIGKSAN